MDVFLKHQQVCVWGENYLTRSIKRLIKCHQRAVTLHPALYCCTEKVAEGGDQAAESKQKASGYVIRPGAFRVSSVENHFMIEHPLFKKQNPSSLLSWVLLYS